jgi:hypothetical protein
MRCQSDYDAETNALLRQTDVCVEEWWEGEPRKLEEHLKTGGDEDPASIVKREVSRRGLAEVDEGTGV